MAKSNKSLPEGVEWVKEPTSDDPGVRKLTKPALIKFKNRYRTRTAAYEPARFGVVVPAGTILPRTAVIMQADYAGEEPAVPTQGPSAADLAAREEAAKSPEFVKAALDELDPENDEHWTAAGKPAVDAVKEKTGSKTLTRADIEKIAPDFKRPEQEDDQGSLGL